MGSFCASRADRLNRQLPFQSCGAGNRLSSRAYLAADFEGGCISCRKITQKAALTRCHKQQGHDSYYTNNHRGFVYSVLQRFFSEMISSISCFEAGCGSEIVSSLFSEAGFGVCAAMTALWIGFEGWLLAG